MKEVKSKIKEAYDLAEDKLQFVYDLRKWIHEDLSQIKQPVDLIHWVDVDKVTANDYNPNSVAKVEMKLLYTSIKHDGYTQPVVTVYDEENDRYVIIDGFHRYLTCKTNKDIRERNKGKLPIVVLEKDINDRMASTVRHNRARGKHSVKGMSSMVFSMLENGWKDNEICNELGREADELLRLKHITGFSKLFEDVDYQQAWISQRQLRLKKQYKDEQRDNDK